MRNALAVISSSPFWALSNEAFHGSLPTLIKRLASYQPTGQEEKATSYDDLEPTYYGPDGSVIEQLDGIDAGSTEGSVAVINVNGMLVKDCMWWEEVLFGLCSMDRVTKLIQQITDDKRVSAVVINCYSHGGMVDGAETLGNAVRDCADQKPCVFFIDSCAASGGYWTGCAATRIMLSGQSSKAGSVGVMMSMFDDIPFWESLGFKYHEEYATKSTNKNIAYRKLRKGDNTEVVRELDELMAVFEGAVKDGRKNKVKSGSEVFTGATYIGQAAIGMGLAESIGSMADAISLARALVRATPASPQSTSPASTTSTASHTNMNIFQKALAKLGLTEEKSTPTAENVAAFNTEVQASGFQLVTTEQATALTGLAALQEKAAKFDELEPKLAEAKTAVDKMTAEVKETLAACKITATEGQEFAALIKHAKAKPGATHTGTTTEAPATESPFNNEKTTAGASLVHPSSVRKPD